MRGICIGETPRRSFRRRHSGDSADGSTFSARMFRSGVQYDAEDCSDPRTIRLARATKNRGMPVVVTIAVQFFESLYASRPSRCRKLHNLTNSAVIFDEAVP